MNITLPRAVIEQALEALVAAYQGKDKTNQVTESITALRTALGQPEQEPVAWGDVKIRPDGKRYCRAIATTDQSHLGYLPLYTAPPQRKPLTDEEIKNALVSVDAETKRLPPGLRAFARAIEAKHGIKE